MFLDFTAYIHAIAQVLTVMYFITILTIIGVVISENRNPVKSLAWITVLLLLPVVGFILYMFFGRSFKQKHIISRTNRMKLYSREQAISVKTEDLPLSEESKRLITLGRSMGGAPYFPGNKIDIFTSGADKFAQLKTDLLAAKEYIHLQYFIFENDTIGTEIADILIQKREEGVNVRVIYDHVGSWHLNMKFFRRLRKHGVDAQPFMKVTFPEFANHVNWRNHRKLIIIDGRVGYIGGMNIADRYVKSMKGDAPWRDTHLRITGEAVAGLQFNFAVDWNAIKRTLLTEPTVHNHRVQAIDPDGIQFIASGPNHEFSYAGMMFHKAIGYAKKRVYIQTPYFLPNDDLLKALQAAALAQIDVRIMLPQRPDSRMLHWASSSYIKQCLLSGIKVYFYQPAMLHAKMLIVDDEFTSTGSTNFDFRSIDYNFECNACIYSRDFNQRARTIFEQDLRQCNAVDLQKWKRRPLHTKAIESLVRLMSPIL